MLLILFLFIFFSLTTTVTAKPIIADLAIRSIDIDHNFSGLDILMFGARNDVGNIVIVIRGPEEKYIVRKKEQFAGMWINRKSVGFDTVPGFYAIAASRPLEVIKNTNLLSSLDIGIENIDFNVSPAYSDISESSKNEFKNALIEDKREISLYNLDVSKISIWGEVLFRTLIKIPKNIIRGNYTAEVYLFHNGLLSSVQSTPLNVKKIGFSAIVFDLANRFALLYGILCVVTALIAGWAASAVFGRM